MGHALVNAWAENLPNAQDLGERRGQTLGVGIAVVDRSSSRHAQHVKGEVGSRSTLVKIVVSRAVVAGVVVLARSASQVRRQRRGRVRPRDHHHARSRNKRRRSSRSTGTRRPDHTHHILIRDQDLCRSLPADFTVFDAKRSICFSVNLFPSSEASRMIFSKSC